TTTGAAEHLDNLLEEFVARIEGLSPGIAGIISVLADEQDAIEGQLSGPPGQGLGDRGIDRQARRACPRTPRSSAVEIPTGPVIPRGVPRLGFVSGASPPAVAAGASGRLELAEWITRPDHPLTARVIANRVWQHHLGRGIVSTPSNFGVRGEQPSHPELLDWLAARLVASGWSIKDL